MQFLVTKAMKACANSIRGGENSNRAKKEIAKARRVTCALRASHLRLHPSSCYTRVQSPLPFPKYVVARCEGNAAIQVISVSLKYNIPYSK